MTAHRPPRADDRWLTPGVVVVLILAGTVVCVCVLAAVTYLTARGYDPQPVVTLAGTLVAAVAAAGNFVLSLLTRRTTTRVERNTGEMARNTGDLASGVYDVADRLDAAVAPRGGLPPVPDPNPPQTVRYTP